MVVEASRFPELSHRPETWLSTSPSWLSSKRPRAVTSMGLLMVNCQPSVKGGLASELPVVEVMVKAAPAFASLVHPTVPRLSIARAPNVAILIFCIFPLSPINVNLAMKLDCNYQAKGSNRVNSSSYGTGYREVHAVM